MNCHHVGLFGVGSITRKNSSISFQGVVSLTGNIYPIEVSRVGQDLDLIWMSGRVGE